MDTGRFAPTTSGRAHPGTLLAALLAWLDARSRQGRLVLRLEDIDPSARRPEARDGLLDDLRWFGLDWDELVWQSQRRADHEAALDALAAQGRLYECSCSRSTIAREGRPAASGGWVYPGTCRAHRVTEWRRSRLNLRVELDPGLQTATDEGGTDLSQDLAAQMGDPLVRRPDGGVTYQLAVVVDDHAAGVTRVVRGRDLATSTATQVALRRLLGYPVPAYRHHLLLLEPQGGKLAKLHQSVGADQLRRGLTAPQLLGFLARLAGLPVEEPEPSWGQVLAAFSWDSVRTGDAVVTWDGRSLRADPSAMSY